MGFPRVPVPGLDPAVHLLSGADYVEVDGESQGPAPVLFTDRASGYRRRYPGDRSERLGPLDPGELGVCAELLAEFALRLRRDIDAGTIDASAGDYADVVAEFADRVFQSRTGPAFD